MFLRFHGVLMLALCSLVSPLVAGAQELLPAVSFRTVANVQFDMWPADFNSDAITDFVALGSSSRLQVWIANGDGTFRTTAPRQVPGRSSVRTRWNCVATRSKSVSRSAVT